MSEPPSTRSKLGCIVGSVLRVAIIGIAVVAVTVAAVVAFNWKKLQQAGASTPWSNIAMLEMAAVQLLDAGFKGCPTAQQVLELSPEPMKNELRQETTGKDPWGTPYQLQCDQRRVHVFSLGPDKVAGTADDILPVL